MNEEHLCQELPVLAFITTKRERSNLDASSFINRGQGQSGFSHVRGSSIGHSAISVFQFFSTLRTQAFQHIIDAMHGESIWKRNHRHGNVLETERTMAVLAIKMRMLFVNRTIAIVVANGVLQRARSIVNGMNQAMKQKQRQGARYG